MRSSPVRTGLLTVSGNHTTTALIINEFQAALLADIVHFLDRLTGDDAGHLHNCEDCSDCERKTAPAHVRAVLLGHQVAVTVCDGNVVLGQWHSILFAEPAGLTAVVLGV